jgi:hypothetical protein
MPDFRIVSGVILTSFLLNATNLTFAAGLLLKVVDQKKQGVPSVIVAQKEAQEIVIGDTDSNGQLVDSEYKCDNDRNLLAHPKDRNYFDSIPEPCKSPQTILVIARTTPKGETAFANWGSVFVLADGSQTQVQVNFTPHVKKSARPVFVWSDTTNGFQDKCKVNYDLTVNKTISHLNNGNWNTISTVDAPLSTIIDLKGISATRLSTLLNERKDSERSTVPVMIGDSSGSGIDFILGQNCDQAGDATTKIDNFINNDLAKYINSGNFNKMAVFESTK